MLVDAVRQMQRGEQAEQSWQSSLARETSELETDYLDDYNDVVVPLLACMHRLKTSVADYRWRVRRHQRTTQERWVDQGKKL